MTAAPIPTFEQPLTIGGSTSSVWYRYWRNLFDLTNILTTKGDLYGFSTQATRVPIGTNGQVLTVDLTQVSGVKWAAPAAGGSPGGSNQQMQYNNAGAFGGSSMKYILANGQIQIPAPTGTGIVALVVTSRNDSYGVSSSTGPIVVDNKTLPGFVLNGNGVYGFGHFYNVGFNTYALGVGTGGLTAPTATITMVGGGGVQIGAPTGGDQGAGTLNATGLYINGVAVSTGGGTPGGSNTQIQYNNSGAFGGTSMTYNNANGTFSIAAPSSGISLTVNGVANGNQQLWSDGTIQTLVGTFGGTKALIGTNTNHALSIITNATDRIAITNAGNVSIAAPASGIALTTNIINNTVGARWTDGALTLDIQTDASHNALFGPTSAHQLNLITGGSNRLIIGSAGNVTITAPSSGAPLAITAPAGASTLLFGGGSSLAWPSGYYALQGAVYASFFDSNSGIAGMPVNAYWNGTNWVYRTTNPAFRLLSNLSGNFFDLAYAASGTAGTNATFTTALSMSGNGNFVIAAPVSGTTLAITSVAAGTPLSITDGTVSASFPLSASQAQYGTSTNHALSFYTNNVTRLTLSNTGNVTVNAPSSGDALTVNGTTTLTTTTTAAVNANSTSGAALKGTSTSGNALELSASANSQYLSISSGSILLGRTDSSNNHSFYTTSAVGIGLGVGNNQNYFFMDGSGAASFGTKNQSAASGSQLTVMAPNAANSLVLQRSGPTTVLTVDSSGQMVMSGAATSATNLKITASSSGLAVWTVGTAVSTPMFRFDTQANTGSTTPAFQNNKPGATTATLKWLPIYLDGTNLYWIPCWLN